MFVFDQKMLLLLKITFMKLLYVLLISLVSTAATAQTDACNKLGAWLWYIDITGFATHGDIADSLQSLGIKRVYVKVADGTINPNVWPELLDTQLVTQYHDRGIECWAWSYNYPTSNDSLQALALYRSAQTGYDGFVVDVEAEFDGDSTNLHDMFASFDAAKQEAMTQGYIDTTFKLYCTTWGNPDDHNFRVDVIDPFVDAFMPQTYVAQWGPSYVNNLAYWIEVGNQEYAQLGATKPLHHIVALESSNINAERIDSFFIVSGGESSLWRIPGGGVSPSLWQVWNDIDWHRDFCEVSPIAAPWLLQKQPSIQPNPIADQSTLTLPFAADVVVHNAVGQPLIHLRLPAGIQLLDLHTLLPGIYYVTIRGAQGYYTLPIVKM